MHYDDDHPPPGGYHWLNFIDHDPGPPLPQVSRSPVTPIRLPKPPRPPRRLVLTPALVREARRRHRRETARAIAASMKVSVWTLHDALNGRTWRHVA